MADEPEKQLAERVSDFLEKEDGKFHYLRVDRVFHEYHDLIIEKRKNGESYDRKTYRDLRDKYLKYKRNLKENTNY